MNLVDAYVTKVISTQEMDFGNGPLVSVQVEYNSYGVLSETSLVFFGDDRQENAAKVSEGYHFLA